MIRFLWHWQMGHKLKLLCVCRVAELILARALVALFVKLSWSSECFEVIRSVKILRQFSRGFSVETRGNLSFLQSSRLRKHRPDDICLCESRFKQFVFFHWLIVYMIWFLCVRQYSGLTYCTLSRSPGPQRSIRQTWSWPNWRGFRNICWNVLTPSCMIGCWVWTLHHRSTECKLLSCCGVGLLVIL